MLLFSKFSLKYKITNALFSKKISMICSFKAIVAVTFFKAKNEPRRHFDFLRNESASKFHYFNLIRDQLKSKIVLETKLLPSLVLS